MALLPGGLPGPVSSTYGRRSRLLFNWRASHLTLDPLTGQAPTFTRASLGGAVPDAAGRLYMPVHSQPRFGLWDVADGLGPSPALVLEDAATNLIPNSENFAAWATIGTIVVTGGQADPFGGTGAYLLTDNDAGVTAAINVVYTPAANDTHTCSVFVAQHPSSSANMFGLFDVTAGTFLCRGKIAWAAGVPTVTIQSGTGTAMVDPAPYVDALGRPWYRVALQVPNVLSANSNKMYLYPTDATTSLTGSVYVFGAQTERYNAPSSYVRTAGASVTRSADVLSYAINFPPQALTIYADLIDLGLVLNATPGPPRAFQLGSNDAADDTIFGILLVSNQYAGRHRADPSGSPLNSSVPNPQPARWNRVEVRTAVGPDGSIQTGASIQGGAEQLGALSASLPFVGAWLANTLNVVYAGNRTYLALRSLKIAAGIQSMTQMRQAL